MARPTMVDEIDGVRNEFWSCPVRFIPGSVWSFLQYKLFYERHASAHFPTFDEVSPRYLRAEMIFEAELSRFLTEGD